MLPRISSVTAHFIRNVHHQIIHQRFVTSSSLTTRTAKQRSKKATSPTEEDLASQEPTVSSKLAREMEDYFDGKHFPTIMEKFPASLLKRSNTAERLYLATPERAKAIEKWVTDGLPRDRLLVEVNPGVGHLTKELVKKVDNLLLYESDERFQPELQKFQQNSKVKLKFDDFNGYWKQCFMDSMDQGSRIDKLLEGLPRRYRWKDEEVNFRLFSVIGSLRFFKSLINTVATQKGLFGLGRCEMFLAVPPLFYVHLTCRRDAGYKLYRGTSVLFQIFFEHEFIAKLPRKDFIPWPRSPSGKGKNLTQYRRLGLVGTDELYLMRVVPRRNLFDFCLPDNLKLLMFFISQNMVSRKNRVIPALERWIPFCGARLILNQNYVASPAQASPQMSDTNDPPTFQKTSSPLRENDFPERLTIFTEFGELTPSQILTVFNEFISWPEFQQSPFLQTMELHYNKYVYGGSRQDSATTLAAETVPAAAKKAIGEDELLEDDEEEEESSEPVNSKRKGT